MKNFTKTILFVVAALISAATFAQVPKYSSMKVVCPGAGKLFSKNRKAYQYLDESIRKFPQGKEFLQIMDKLGYQKTTNKSLSLGICSIYCGEK